MKVLVWHAVACWSFQSNLERGLYSYHGYRGGGAEIFLKITWVDVSREFSLV